MPNHCNNKLQITGTGEEIAEFVKNITVDGDKPNQKKVSLFGTVLPMPKELEDTTSNPDVSNSDLIRKYGADNWYDWANNNWGTKWGDYDTALYILSLKCIELVYDTAWGPGLEFITEVLPVKFPTMSFYLEYEEPGMGFGGSVIIREGEVENNSAYNFEFATDDSGEILEDDNGEWIKIIKEEEKYV